MRRTKTEVDAAYRPQGSSFGHECVCMAGSWQLDTKRDKVHIWNNQQVGSWSWLLNKEPPPPPEAGKTHAPHFDDETALVKVC